MNKNNEDNYEFVPTSDSNNYYTISDFELSTYLVSIGFPLVSIEEKTNGKSLFTFKCDSGVEKAVDEYWNGRALVNPLELTNARKNLKSRLLGTSKYYKY